jgi:hypothetical protein
MNIFLVGSHSKEKILRHLLLRILLRTPSRAEKELLRTIAALSNNWWYSISEILLEENYQHMFTTRVKRAVLALMQLYPEFGMEDPVRTLGSYDPRIFFFRKWKSSRKKVIFPSTMGVGYKDKGSLRPATQIKVWESPGELGSPNPSLEEFLMSLGILLGTLQSSSLTSGLRRPGASD